MARIFVALALALFASVNAKKVYADYGQYIYSTEQVREINRRLVKCLSQVPPESDFNRPGDVCRFVGIDVLYEQGATKEAIVAPIVKCLKERSVDAVDVNKASKCLTESLSEPLVAA